MSDPKERFERWWGSGIIWQLFLVACATVGVYYTRIQALNSETPGREAIAKIQQEAKSNFDKLQGTLRLIDERMVKLEKSEQAARQDLAIADLRRELAELKDKQKSPANAERLDSAIQAVDRLSASRALARPRLNYWPDTTLHDPGKRALILPELHGPTSSLLNKTDFLGTLEKQSIQHKLDALAIAQQPTFSPLETPKFHFSPLPISPPPQTFVERAVSTSKTYWFLIFIMIVAIFSRK
jgi:hypothetical protein